MKEILETKECSDCKVVKPLEEFHSNGYHKKSGKKKRKGRCKQCYTDLAYGEYKDKITQAVKEAGRELKCERCGYDKSYAALEFHHDQGIKNIKISGMRTSSMEKVRKEISLCEILCACCHRIEHSPER